jgi:hypothetical protein
MSESQPKSGDPLDRFLAISMSARPEAKPVSNLAERAVERARMLDRLADQQRRRLVIHRWRLRAVYAAAALLIGALILLGADRLLSEQRSMADADQSISTSDSTASGTATYVLWLGGLLFISTIAGLATESAIASDRALLV